MATNAPLSPAELSNIYSFPDGTDGANQRVVLLEFGGGFHNADLDQHAAGLNTTVGNVTVIEVGAINAPLPRETLRRIAQDFNGDGISFDQLEAAHGPSFMKFLDTLEVTADIQIVRAFAPKADIDVLFAQLGPSAGSVIEFALDNHDPTVIATSWGTSEWRRSFIEVRAVLRALEKAREQGVTVCCASGDFGSRNDPPNLGLRDAPTGKTRVNWPASCPLALACGGSQLRLEDGVRRDEVVWETDFLGIRRATGGGMSGRYTRPSWQQPREAPSEVWTQSGLNNFDGRWLPDVSAHAARTYEVVVGGEKTLVDGTSIAAPLWAALLACISQKLNRKVGWINEKLYTKPEKHAVAFNDVTSGTNAMPHEIASHFNAETGWDPCTGLGSPKGIGLVDLLG
jgi:kumamolisin